MTQELSDFKISEYCLVIDILGTVNRMSNASYFADSLLDLLNVVTQAYYETTDIADVTDSQPFFQYADTLIFPNDSTDELVSLGCRLFNTCLRKEILLQGCISGRGLFHIPDISVLKSIKKARKDINSMLVFGLGFVSSFACMKGVYGPRLLINEDFGGIFPNPGRWHHYLNTSRFLSKDTLDSFNISEVRWWEPDHDIDDFVNRLIIKTEKEYASRKEWLGNNITNQERREFRGFDARLRHLRTFQEMLLPENDPMM